MEKRIVYGLLPSLLVYSIRLLVQIANIPARIAGTASIWNVTGANISLIPAGMTYVRYKGYIVHFPQGAVQEVGAAMGMMGVGTKLADSAVMEHIPRQ